MTKITKYFLIAFAGVLAVSLIWMVVLATSVGERAQFFASGGYDAFIPPHPETNAKASEVMARQSSRAIFHLFVVAMLAGGVMANLLWLRGAARPALRWGGCGLLALIFYVEQWSANSHFMEYYRPGQVYSDNAVFQRLRTDPGRPRVALLTRGGFYNTWLSLLFPYWDIDSIDIPAASRPPADYTAFFGAVDRSPLRKWELCSVKYILGPKDAAEQSFKQQGWDKFMTVALEFDSQFGKQALFECARALPRALVLHRWEVLGDNEKLLARLADPQFDPRAVVLLDTDPPVRSDPHAPPSTAADFTSFKPTRVVIKTALKSPGILMLNDRYDGAWTVTVNDAPAKMLRANFIMRAVALEPGEHRVVFRYSTPASSRLIVQVEWAAIGLGLFATAIGALRRKLGT